MNNSTEFVQTSLPSGEIPKQLATSRLIATGPSRRRVMTASVISGLQLLLDLVGIALAMVLGDRYLEAPPGSEVAIVILLFSGVNLLLLRSLGFYGIDLLTRWPLYSHRLLLFVLVNMALMGGVVWILPQQISPNFNWAVSVAGLSLFFFWTSRTAVALALRWGLQRGLLGENIAVVGTGDIARRFIRVSQSQGQDNWWRIVGVFENSDNYRRGVCEEIPVLGALSDIEHHVREGEVEHVVIALTPGASEQFDATREKLATLPVTLSLAWDRSVHAGVRGTDLSVHGSPLDASGISLLTLNKPPSFGWPVIVKWLEDKFLALFILILLAPLLLAIVLMIKLDSPGPVFFRQKRYGFNKKPIMVFKFRTMHHKKNGEQVFRQATKNDSRVTRIGRILRRTSLDELPQLFNVIDGGMSLVGPRPHPVELDDYFMALIGGLEERHCVKPGITGWAQINGYRGETDTLEKMQARIACDVSYIENWSFWLDMKILLRTVVGGWIDENAY